MGFVKRTLDEIRDEGLDAFNEGESRDNCPYENPIQRQYWLDGWDYAADIEILSRQRPMTDDEICEMLDYHFAAMVG